MAKVIVIGSGGREHALGWKLGQSDHVSEVIYAPGNAGTSGEMKGRNIPIDGAKKENFSALEEFIRNENIDMVVVGPEQPLADGIVDFLNSRGFDSVFGPDANHAYLEKDKFYSYQLMRELKIPQAKSFLCVGLEEIYAAMKEIEKPVLKHRWLAGGKGVRVYNSRNDALIDMEDFVENFGGETLVAERLYGEEFSVFGIADGKSLIPLEMSFQDHKPLLDYDLGPNTGGMGAYGPAPIAPTEVVQKVANEIMTPIVAEISYHGFLYAGMMMTPEGPKVLEFNVRLGDPECQPAMMMLKNDLFDILSLSLEGKLDQIKPEFYPGAACCVVLTSRGYPQNYDSEKGKEISGLECIKELNGVKVFHAGTKQVRNSVVIFGGRVLGVTGYSDGGIVEARNRAYAAVSRIHVNGGFHYRKDIGNKVLMS